MFCTLKSGMLLARANTMIILSKLSYNLQWIWTQRLWSVMWFGQICTIHGKWSVKMYITIYFLIFGKKTKNSLNQLIKSVFTQSWLNFVSVVSLSCNIDDWGAVLIGLFAGHLLKWKWIYGHFGVLMFLIQKTDFNCFVSKVQRCLHLHMPVWLLFMFWQTPKERKILVPWLTNTFMGVFCWKVFVISVILPVVEKACMIFTARPDDSETKQWSCQSSQQNVTVCQSQKDSSKEATSDSQSFLQAGPVSVKTIKVYFVF